MLRELFPQRSDSKVALLTLQLPIWHRILSSLKCTGPRATFVLGSYMNSAIRTAKNFKNLLSGKRSSQPFSNTPQYPNKLQVTNIKQDLLAPQLTVQKVCREMLQRGNRKRHSKRVLTNYQTVTLIVCSSNRS